MEEGLIRFISDRYPLDGVTIERKLETKGTRIAFRISSDGGEFVVKLTPPDRPEAQVRRDVDILRYVARFDFPAPRLLRAGDGSWFVPFEDRFVTLYRYIQGDTPQPDILLFEEIGDLLAHLHSLPPPLGAFPSDYRPEIELPRVKEALVHLNHSKDAERARKLTKDIDDFPLFDQLPKALIHTDPWFENIIRSARGELSFIDWDDAGLSYPVLDVGYVLAHLCTYTPQNQGEGDAAATARIAWRPDWAAVFLASYSRRRPLSQTEIEFLPRAIEFSLLAYVVDWSDARIFPGNYRRLEIFQEQDLLPLWRSLSKTQYRRRSESAHGSARNDEP